MNTVYGCFIWKNYLYLSPEQADRDWNFNVKQCEQWALLRRLESISIFDKHISFPEEVR